MKCSYCGHESPEGVLFCSECGMKLVLLPPSDEQKGIRCPNCGAVTFEGNVCKSCGASLSEASVAASTRTCPLCGFDENPLIAKFCMQCGAEISDTEEISLVRPPAKLVLPSKREITLSGKETIVGRTDFLEDISPEESKFISREHLKVVFEDGKYFAMDEKSTNGTKLNGREIKRRGKRELSDNDKIVLADTVELKFRIG
ncbi:MAG: zinc ribbon domain-containing protein [Theionarchaea archaeon]|nr:zinc ribbon domain-containing protein [Theionarchaea archaeon]